MTYKPKYPDEGELGILDAQDVFDRVATHLIKQGRPSLSQSGTCLYRGPQGTACAVGVLIPESLYSRRFEGKGVNTLIATAYRGQKDHLGRFLGDHRDLLNDLQVVHDDALPADWKEELRAVAKKHKLKTSVLKGL